MSEKRFSETEKNCYYTSLVFDKKTQEELGTSKVAKLLNALYEENKQLKETNEKLQWDLNKTREDLNYFANLKVSAMRGSDCGHDRCYVTSMQKRGDE